jgi:hypothetical protein
MFLTELELERYPNSWSYMTQACRGLGTLGHKYFDGERLIGIGSHNSHYVIVNPIGHDLSDMPVFLTNLCGDLHRLSGKPVYLKHVKERDQQGMSDKFAPMESYPWKEGEPCDDATYPEVITACESILEIRSGEEPKGDRKFRARLNAFTNALEPLSDPYFLAVPYVDERSHIRHQEGVMELLKTWADGDAELAEPYLNMINHPSQSGFSFVMLLQGRPVGFYVFDRIGVHTAGGYAMITDHKHISGASEACFYMAAAELKRFGISHLNLGGSERESLHTYKMKIGSATVRDTRKEQIVYVG